MSTGWVLRGLLHLLIRGMVTMPQTQAPSQQTIHPAYVPSHTLAAAAAAAAPDLALALALALASASVICI
jgi:hypothetical protein